LTPGNCNTSNRSGQVDRQRVSCHRSDEHTGSNRGRLEDSCHDVTSHLLLGLIRRIGTARDAQRLRQRQENTPGSRRQRRDRRRQKCFGKHQGIRQTQSRGTEQRDDVIRDAVPQAGFNKASRQEKSNRNQPRNFTSKRGKGRRKRQQTRRHGYTETNHSYCTQR